MRQLTADTLTSLRTSHEPPCISLYQPTHRAHPDNLQDPIRYRNLARDMETSLKEKYSARDVEALMEKYRALERDVEFWNHRTDGLAILSSPETFEIFDLQRPVQELLVVASNFYTKPLVRVLQSADRYQILCLTRSEARLFEGNRDALDPIDLSDIPSTASEVLGEERTKSRVSVRSIPGGGSFYHGGGGAKDQTDIDRDRFFRAIDRAILENHSRPSGLPLLLAALTENQAPFRAVSHNPFLLANGIQIEPSSLDLDQLRALAWKEVEPGYLKRLAGLLERYHSAKSRQMASDDIGQVAEATVAGRVGSLLVEADRQIPGRLDEATGRIEHGDPSHPEIGDVLNDLAETVARMKGDVVVVPAERMPSTTGIAATYRF
jgi:hypothetical protein